MVQVLNGTISDGYKRILGWIWIACAITTIGLVVMTWFALKERYYSAVMAATGLLYLAILTAFGTDLGRPSRAPTLIGFLREPFVVRVRKNARQTTFVWSRLRARARE